MTVTIIIIKISYTDAGMLEIRNSKKGNEMSMKSSDKSREKNEK